MLSTNGDKTMSDGYEPNRKEKKNRCINVVLNIIPIFFPEIFCMVGI